MSSMYMGLRGMIYAKFQSAAAFADCLGWPRQKISLIMNGSRTPSLNDVKTMAEALERPFMDVAQFFLTSESPDGDE